MSTPASRATILVVDDEPNVRESLGDAFTDEGYAVVLAANGREALARARMLARPCVVILDLIMPVMSGDQVYAAMRADPALEDIPIVVSTSDPTRAPAFISVSVRP